MSFRSTRLAVMLAIVAWTAAGAGAITLVKDGQPVATIVIRDSAVAAQPYKPAAASNDVPSPDAKVRLAANDLQVYIEKISGAKLPIAGDTAEVKGAVVLVGTSKRTEPLKLDIPRGVTREKNEEGYVLIARGDALVLAGNEDGMYFGTYYAVAEFLHRLGVRWYMPGPPELGEVVPSLKTVAFDDVEFRDKPDFRLRTWWGYEPPEQADQEMLWKLRNKMQVFPLMVAAGDSTIRQWMPDAALTKTKPELFGRNADGTPDAYNPSFSNPEIVQLVAHKMKDHCKAEVAKSGKPPEMLACAPDDGIPVDFAPESRKVNQGFTELVGREGEYQEISISEEWFGFMNKVAAELAKEYPDVLIATNGYANRNMPPEGMELHPNLSVLYASIWADTLKAFDNPRSWHGAIQGACLKRWCELNKRVNLYRYDYTMLGTSLTPVPTVRKMAHDYPLYKKWGVIGFVDENKPAAWMEQGITTFYLRARLNWRGDLDVTKELDDYFGKWYGPAAAPARAFWDALEERIENAPILGHEERILPYVYTPELVAALEKYAAEEERLADTPVVKTRVAIDRATLNHLKAYLAMWEADFSGNYAEAARQCDAMAAERAKLNAISQFLNQPEYGYEDGMKRYWAGTWGSGLNWKKPAYEKLAEMTNGKAGELLAMGARQTKFTLDEADMGKSLRWYDPAFDRSKWETIDTTKPFYIQGHQSEAGVPYRGLMWYAFDMDVPASASGKPAKLYSPVVVCEAWVWVNGQYAGHRPYIEPYTRPAVLDLEVTKLLKPGQKNTIAVRVSTSTNRTQGPDGFQGRLFLYSPRNEAAATAK